MAYSKPIMTSSNQHSTAIKTSLKLAKKHYENFPVASFFLPKRLRQPIALIYTFARQADDFADEGDLSAEQRLALLNGVIGHISIADEKSYAIATVILESR